MMEVWFFISLSRVFWINFLDLEFKVEVVLFRISIGGFFRMVWVIVSCCCCFLFSLLFWFLILVW